MNDHGMAIDSSWIDSSVGPGWDGRRRRQDVTEYGAICESDLNGPAIDE